MSPLTISQELVRVYINLNFMQQSKAEYSSLLVTANHISVRYVWSESSVSSSTGSAYFPFLFSPSTCIVATLLP